MDYSGSPTSWDWSFGDGGTSIDQNASHTYTSAGTYTVSLTVVNAAGSDTEVKEGYVTVTGYPARYLFVEAGEGGCAESDVQSFRQALFGSNKHGWRDFDNPTDDSTFPTQNPILSINARVKHWADGTRQDFVDNADFAYFHGHGNMDGNPSIHFDNADPDGIHDLRSDMADWGYETGSRLKWITFHSCDTLSYETWETWIQSFKGLHMIIGYDTSTSCASNPPTGQIFAQLMRGEYPGYPTQSIMSSWITANQISYPTGNYQIGTIYVVGCDSDYLPGFGGDCGNPQRNPTTNEFDISYYPLPMNPVSYAVSPNILQENQELKKTQGVFSVDTRIISIPQTIMIYKPVNPVYLKERMNKLSKELDITVTESLDKKDNISVTLESADRTLVVQKQSRVVSYENSVLRKKLLQETTQGKLPSDQDAVNKITHILQESGMMPVDAVVDEPRHNVIGRLTASNKIQRSNEEIIVFFHREKDGLFVENSKIMAEVNEFGEIISLFMNWRDYEPYKEVSIKPIDTAFNEFTKGFLQKQKNGKPQKVVITNISLRYYSQPAAANENYLQPVYVFEGYVQDGENVMPFTPIYILATDEQFDKIPY